MRGRGVFVLLLVLSALAALQLAGEQVFSGHPNNTEWDGTSALSAAQRMAGLE